MREAEQISKYRETNLLAYDQQRPQEDFLRHRLFEDSSKYGVTS